jgi:hypothetical protein
VEEKKMYVKLISIKFVKNIKFNLTPTFVATNSYITVDDTKINEKFADNVNISTTDTREHVLSIWSNFDNHYPRYGEELINNVKISAEEKTTDDDTNNEKIIVFSDDEKIFEDIIDKSRGNFEYEFDSIKNRNIKIYVSNKKDNTNINISDIKYASNNTIEIEYENKNVLSDEDLNRISYQSLRNIIYDKYALTINERNKISNISNFINNKNSLMNLQFPVERPVTYEYIQNNGYSDLRDFINNSSYWDLLSEEERNIMSNINEGYSTMSEEEIGEFLMELYNKYEISEEMFIEKENELKEYLINLYKKYAGDRNVIQKYKSNDNISDLNSMSINELLNKVSTLDNRSSFKDNEKNKISNISNFINNKNSLMNLQFPVERPIENKLIYGGRVYVFK